MGKISDKISITNDTSLLLSVRDFITRMIRASQLPNNEWNRVILAVDEAVTNIIEHAYSNDTEGEIEIEVEVTQQHFKIVISDRGKSFDPASVPMFDLAGYLRSGKRKGLGIFLMRQVMDEVRYSFKPGGKNELTLIKYIR
jgi:anti-sigma regulatory factor (Ser/Thr protein kinase)